MSCDVCKTTEGLEHELWRRWSDGKVGELAELVGEVSRAQSPTYPSLYLRRSSFSNPSFASAMSQLILQPFRRFTYVAAHSPTFPSLYLRHSSFSTPSVTSSMSKLILQLFFRFSYVTGSSLTSPGEPPMHMRWVWRNGWMKFIGGENPEKNVPQLGFVHHETHMKWSRRELGTWAVGGECLTTCVMEPPPSFYNIKLNWISIAVAWSIEILSCNLV